MNTNKWFDYFIVNGLINEQAILLSTYASSLNDKGLPIIFEADHLAKLIGIDAAYVSKVVRMSSMFYRSFDIEKRSGGKRNIDSPYPKLAYIQDWIKVNILDTLTVSEHSFSYVKGRSIIGNAKCHVGSKELLKLDLVNFFKHISEHSVSQIFTQVGYTQKLSLQFAKICCVDGSLPQGASTSPVLSNLVLKDLDYNLVKISKKYNLNYSRYADDLTFSGNSISNEAKEDIRYSIKSFDFIVNEKKFRHLVGDKRKIVTGLCVNGLEVRVPKRDRREFRKSSHYLLINGYRQFNGDKGELSPLYIDKIIGKGQYILNVEPMNKYVKETLNKLIHLRKTFLQQ